MSVYTPPMAGRSSTGTAGVSFLVRAHVAAVAATMVRRRSMTQSLQLGLSASFDVMQDQLDEHVSAVGRVYAGAGPVGSDRTAALVHDTLHLWWCRYLDRLGALQGTVWQRPVPELARLVLATMIGLVRPYSGSDDVDQSRELLLVLAFDLARHGQRDNQHTATAAARDQQRRPLAPPTGGTPPVTALGGDGHDVLALRAVLSPDWGEVASRPQVVPTPRDPASGSCPRCGADLPTAQNDLR